MNPKALLQLPYYKFTHKERRRLTLAAVARGDFAEADRLFDSCPQMTLVAPDPKFSQSVHKIFNTASAVLQHWIEVSHYVVRDYIFIQALDFVRECESLKLRLGENSSEDIEKLETEYAALAAKLKADWKAWSAMWRGIESGITKFCTAVELSGEQLLSTTQLPAPIEEARKLLDPKSRVSRACKEDTYQMLRQAW